MGEFELCLGGLGNLNRKSQVQKFVAIGYTWSLLLDMDEFLGKDSAFVSEWLTGQNELFKAR